MKSAMADLIEGGKEWAGLVYIGGTHPAAAGATYMTVVEGFAGICTENGRLVCHPHLPQSMEELEFSVIYQNREYRVHIDQRKERLQSSDAVAFNQPGGKRDISGIQGLPIQQLQHEIYRKATLQIHILMNRGQWRSD